MRKHECEANAIKTFNFHETEEGGSFRTGRDGDG